MQWQICTQRCESFRPPTFVATKGNRPSDGTLLLMVESRVERARIPRDKQNDYTEEAASQRRAFAEQHTGVHLDHVARYSFDPACCRGI